MTIEIIGGIINTRGIGMNYMHPSRCSVCGEELKVTRLSCPNCQSEITGEFSACRYCAINDKLKLFLETFLKSRGNIKDVERSLSISYPTVKSLLDELLATLFLEETVQKEKECSSKEILDMLERGEITAAQAAKMLSKSGGR